MQSGISLDLAYVIRDFVYFLGHYACYSILR